MADGDTDRPGTGARLLAVLGGLVSFRVAIALSTSVAVTGAVAGPLTLLALKDRDPEVAAAPAGTVPPRAAPTPGAPAPPVESPVVTPPAEPPVEAEPVVGGRVLRPTTTTAPATPAPTSTTTTLDADPPLVGTGLSTGVSPGREDGIDLDGATVAGRVYLFVTQPGVTAVRWWLDRTPASGPPTRSSTTPPFDLGVSTLDTSTLSVGKHSVYVEFDTASGVIRRSATFDVVR